MASSKDANRGSKGARHEFLGALAIVLSAILLGFLVSSWSGTCSEGGEGYRAVGAISQVVAIGIAVVALTTGRHILWTWPIGFAVGIAATIAAVSDSLGDCLA